MVYVLSSRALELVRKMRESKTNPNYEQTQRYFRILREQGLRAAFFSGMSLEQGCDFLEARRGENS